MAEAMTTALINLFRLNNRPESFVSPGWALSEGFAHLISRRHENSLSGRHRNDPFSIIN
jgi:hypothetical protein